jgi:hypothetical protein
MVDRNTDRENERKRDRQNERNTDIEKRERQKEKRGPKDNVTEWKGFLTTYQ